MPFANNGECLVGVDLKSFMSLRRGRKRYRLTRGGPTAMLIDATVDSQDMTAAAVK